MQRLCCVVLVFIAFSSGAFAESYYVDCSINGNGIGRFRGTLDKPWNSLTTVSTRTFLAGDAIFLKRGTTCTGMLAPKGSGEAGAPISIGAYGSGPRPIIDAGTSAAAIQLFNQSYWAIRDVETTGGNPHGIHISGDAAATLTYFRISNVSVHDVGGFATTKQSGLIDISPPRGSPTIVDDVIVDGVTVFNTEQWMGIHVTCKDGIVPAPNASSIIIRNRSKSDAGQQSLLGDEWCATVGPWRRVLDLVCVLPGRDRPRGAGAVCRSAAGGGDASASRPFHYRLQVAFRLAGNRPRRSHQPDEWP